MKTIIYILFLTFSVSLKAIPWTYEALLKINQVEDVQASNEGTHVLYTALQTDLANDHYIRRLYIAPLSDAQKVETPFGDRSCFSPQWSPNQLQIATIAYDDQGHRQIWLLDLSKKQYRQLTFMDRDATSLKWSPDGLQLAFTVAGELWVISQDNNQSKRLTAGVGALEAFGGGGYDWSPDGKSIVFALFPTEQPDGWKKSRLGLMHLESGKIKLLTEEIGAFSPQYSPDGRWIAFIASVGTPAWPLDLRTFILGKEGMKPLALTFDQLPGKVVGWSSDNQTVYVTEKKKTGQTLIALSRDGKTATDLFPSGTHFSDITLNSQRSHLGLNLQSLDKLAEGYISPLKTFQPVQISRTNQEFASYTIPTTELIQWKSTDGLEIEGLLTYPNNYKEGKRYPLVLIIHGGPLTGFTQDCVASTSGCGPIPLLTQLGCFILRCNNRGSTGYGKSFRHANYRDWGGKDYEDLIAGVDHLIKQGMIDEKRMGVMGWSYGGYLTAWALAKTDRFKAAIVGAGFCNCVSYARTTDLPSFLSDYFGADLKTDQARYRRFSPLFHLQEGTTATLLQHGEQDRRVPVGQSYELYQKLRQLHYPVQMMVYPNMGHHSRNPQLTRELLQGRVDWLSRFLFLN